MSDVTVWNLSPEKAAAIMASSLIRVCVTNWMASNRILGEVGTELSGKLLVQFTTGSPQEARASASQSITREVIQC